MEFSFYLLIKSSLHILQRQPHDLIISSANLNRQFCNICSTPLPFSHACHGYATWILYSIVLFQGSSPKRKDENVDLLAWWLSFGERETCRIESIVSIILVHLKNYVYDITDFSSLVFLPHWLLKHSCFPLLVPRRRGIISSIENSNCVSLDCICWFFFFNFTLCISSFFFRLHHAPGTA